MFKNRSDIGGVAALICMFIACVLAAGIMMLGGGSGARLMGRFIVQLSAGLGSGFLAAWLLGRWGYRHTRQGRGLAMAAGTCVALGALLAAVLGGSSVSLVLYESSGFGLAADIFDYVVKPLYWVGGVGFIPAVVLGTVYAVLCRRIGGRPAETEGEELSAAAPG